MNEIVKRLREISSEYDDELMYIPHEIAAIIHGKQKDEWERVRVSKVLSYFADILDEEFVKTLEASFENVESK